MPEIKRIQLRSGADIQNKILAKCSSLESLEFLMKSRSRSFNNEVSVSKVTLSTASLV